MEQIIGLDRLQELQVLKGLKGLKDLRVRKDQQVLKD
jgi:hypothetical protein